MYWALTAIFTFFQSRLERRIGKGYVRGDTGKKSAKSSPPRVRAAREGTCPIVIEEPTGGPELPGQGH